MVYNRPKPPERNNHKMSDNSSLYSIIAKSLVNGELPFEFSLPDTSAEEGKPKWADGAEDGVMIFHMAPGVPAEEDFELMGRAVFAASDKNFDLADELFAQLGKKQRAVRLIDYLQRYVIDNRDKLNPGSIFEYSYRVVKESSDKETVKFGMSLLELLNTDVHPEVKDTIRTIGLSDEFTIFAVFLARTWTDGNNEVFQLAKKVRGWGRIHAIERLVPDTEEIKRWLLLDGVHNSIMYSYSAIDCWAGSGAAEVLKKGPTREEFTGIRDIIEGLCDEGPVKGLSVVENAEEYILLFLKAARDFELDDYDRRIIREIKVFYEDNDHPNKDIAYICGQIAQS